MTKPIRIAAGIAALAASQPLAAQDRPVEASMIDALAACLDIRSDPERLACSDSAARRLVDASRRKEIVIVDREEVKSTRRSLFGFTLPRIALFGKDGPDKPEDAIEQLEARIVQVIDLGYRKYGVTFEGGARWNTTEAWTSPTFPAPGLTATIKRGALGSYFLKIGKERAVRAMRVG